MADNAGQVGRLSLLTHSPNIRIAQVGRLTLMTPFKPAPRSAPTVQVTYLT